MWAKIFTRNSKIIVYNLQYTIINQLNESVIFVFVVLDLTYFIACIIKLCTYLFSFSHVFLTQIQEYLLSNWRQRNLTYSNVLKSNILTLKNICYGFKSSLL